MKWKQQMQDFGLTEETVSIGLRNKIKDYYALVEGIEGLKESIENPSINDDVDDLQSDLESLEEAVENADRQLVKALEVYDRNKEKYAELSKNLGKGRPKKNTQDSSSQDAEKQKARQEELRQQKAQDAAMQQQTQDAALQQQAQYYAARQQQAQGASRQQQQNASTQSAKDGKVLDGEKPKSKSGGWIIFSIAALVLTAGAVNLFKND